MSAYMPKVTGQEDYVYVYTLGVPGLGDGNDKLVTIGANPDRPGYGKVLHQAPIPGRHEAHHGDFTDDRRFLWLGGLDTSQIFVFDVATVEEATALLATDPAVAGGALAYEAFGWYSSAALRETPGIHRRIDNTIRPR